MAMTPQQARMEAMRLRARRPDLQSMAVEDLISQIMAAEGMGAPGAGGGLANLFPTKLSPASPAPMMAARLEAAKPTADIVPGAGVDAFRRAQEVRQQTDRGPTVGERDAANAQRQALVAEVRGGAGAPAPEVAATPVRETAPVAVAEAAPKATYRSRYRPILEQKQAELEQLKATIPAGAETPPALASNLRNLSGVVSRLQGIVAAEEGAVVDADRAALLDRQTARLGREEELIDQARKRAPFDALIAAGTALGSARPGESFTSALTRGLAAGSEKYTGARDTREAALRGIEERRDAYTLQKIDALQSARDKAIEMANAGVQLTRDEYALASLEDADVVAMGTQQARIDEAKARADKAQTEARFAPLKAQSELDVDQAQISNYLETRGSGSGGSGGSGEKPLSPTQAFNRAEASRKRLADLEEKIITSDKSGNHANTERLLNQYRANRDAYNRNAAGAGLAPITGRGFPVRLPKFEEHVAKKKAYPSGRTVKDYNLTEALSKYG
jgi:hypothetical protein